MAGGETIHWYTPPEVYEWMGIHFAVDPCSPGIEHIPWSTAAIHLTEEDDGLGNSWPEGPAFMNWPYDSRTNHLWLWRLLTQPGGGIGLGHAKVETDWFQDYVLLADGIFFPDGRIPFLRPGQDPTDKKSRTSYLCGQFFMSVGEECTAALIAMERRGLGWFAPGRGMKRAA